MHLHIMHSTLEQKAEGSYYIISGEESRSMSISGDGSRIVVLSGKVNMCGVYTLWRGEQECGGILYGARSLEERTGT